MTATGPAALPIDVERVPGHVEHDAFHREFVPMEFLTPVLEWTVAVINFSGTIILCWGVVAGLIAFFKMEFRRCGRCELDRLRFRLRQTVGFYLLTGLELLIAADIIETMIEPTIERLGILAGVAGIRIVTSFALGKELEHGAKALGIDMNEPDEADQGRTEA